jgi:redox-sensing transcriptional repressor
MHQLNKSLVLRLVRYLRVLKKLKSLGIINVFSNNLGDAVGVTPAVVRKDFSLINIQGNKRGGYNIDTLMAELRGILGKQEKQDVIIVGFGRIGQALINYKEFDKEGIRILAAFDNDPAKINRELPVPVLPMEELDAFVRSQDIEVAILTVPEGVANQVFDDMINSGVRGFLNFTSIELKCVGRCDKATCPHNCTVHNVNIGLELENLFYLINMEQLRENAAEELGIFHGV